MRRLTAVILVVLVVLSGCLSSKPSGVNPGDQAPIWHRHEIDMRELDYREELQRWELVALNPLEYNVSWDSVWGSYSGKEEECVAFSFQIYDEISSTDSRNGYSFVMWAWRNNLARTEATLAGEKFTIGHDSIDQASAGSPVHDGRSFNGSLPAGARIVVELGGRSSEFAKDQHYDGQFRDNQAVLSIEHTGDVDLNPLPPAPLRCGTSLIQSENTLFGFNNFAQVAVQGSLGLETQTASTLIFLNDISSSEQTLQQYQVEFLNTSWDTPRELSLSSSHSGNLGVHFDHWIGVVPTRPVWLLADTHWPWVVEQDDASAKGFE